MLDKQFRNTYWSTLFYDKIISRLQSFFPGTGSCLWCLPLPSVSFLKNLSRRRLKECPGKCAVYGTRSTWACLLHLVSLPSTGSSLFHGTPWRPWTWPSPSSAPPSPSPTSSTSPASTGCSSRGSTSFSRSVPSSTPSTPNHHNRPSGPVSSLLGLDQVQTLPIIWPRRADCEHPCLVCPATS